jgi:hypothetical protein
MRISSLSSILLVLSIALLSACATHVPATVTVNPPVPIQKDAAIFVLAQVERERIVQSLSDAGLTVTDKWTGDGYSLTVRIGSNRGSSECGGTHNVDYTLSDSGQRLLVIKGRGQTGSCEPNIFDDMSQKLASLSS